MVFPPFYFCKKNNVKEFVLLFHFIDSEKALRRNARLFSRNNQNYRIVFQNFSLPLQPNSKRTPDW